MNPTCDDLLWTIAAARLILPADVHVQAPPNLSPGVYQKLIGAGIDDWGGVSPVTPDHVNPEAPWPELEALASAHGGDGQDPGAAAAGLSGMGGRHRRGGCIRRSRPA